MSGANTANINKTLAKYPGITKKKGLFNLNSLLNSDPNEANKANNDFNKLAKEKRQLEKVRFQTEFYFKETIRQLRVLYIANIIPLGYYYWCVCKIQNMIIDMKLTYDEIISNKNSFSEAQQKRLYKDIGYGNGITSRMLNTLAKRKTISNLLDKVSLIDNECYERQFWIKRETEFNETNKTYLNIDSNTNNYYHWVLYLPVVLYETIEYPVGSGNMKDIKRSALIDIFKFAQEGYSNIRNNYTFNDINNANDVVNIQKSGGRIKKQFNNDTNLYKSNTHGYKEVPSIIYLEDLFKVDNNLYMSNFQSVIGNYEQLPVYCKKINKAKYTKNNTNIFNYENDTYFKVRPMILSGSEKTFNSLLKSGNIKNDKCNIPFFLIDCRNNSTMSQKYIRVLFYQLLYSLPATYDPNKLYDYYDNLINKWINLEKTKYSDIKDGKKEKNIEETYNFEQERLVDSSASTTLIEKKIKKNNDNNEIIELSFLNVNALINAKDIYGKSEWIDTRGSVIDNDKMNKFLNKFKFNFTTNFRTSLLIGSTLNNLPYNSDFKVNMPPSIPDTDPYIKTDLIRINNYNIDENLNYYLPYKMNTINSGSIDYNNYLPGNTVNIQEYLSRHKFSSTMNIYRDYFLRRFRTNFYLPALWRLKTTNLVDNSGNMNEFNPKYEGRTRNKLMVDSNLFSKLSPIISDLATDKSKQNIVDRRIKAKGYESGNTCFVSIIQLKKLLLSYEEPEGVLDSFGAKIGNNDTLKNDFFENL